MASIGRRTPDHPPYALMIDVAIRSLSEKGGSTEESISRFIRSNYDGIPWGHDKLLPYYLNKLTAVAELDIVTPGRYVITPQEQFREEEGREKSYGEERSDIEEGWPIHCEGDLVKLVQALSTSFTGPKPIDEHQKKPERRGRPRKKMRPTETVGPTTIADEPMDLQVEEPKRRGRPRKEKQKNVEVVGPINSSLISSEPMGLKRDGVESKKCHQEKLVGPIEGTSCKRRGRPPKPKPQVLDS